MLEQFDDETIDRLLKEHPPEVLTEEEKAGRRLERERIKAEELQKNISLKTTKLWKATVPERYWHTSLPNLQPSEKSHMALDKQQKIIDIMNAAPAAGYCFLSPSGWSKSTFMYALYRDALNRNAWDIAENGMLRLWKLHPVVFLDAKELMDRIQAWKIGDADPPVVTAGKIARLKREFDIKTCLFIDEFEKVKKSEFRMTEMYDIINACYKHNAQLVIAGNMTKADLDDKNQYLEGTFRRIEDLTTPHFWEFRGK
jgi:DNA replication protein DnaC